MYLISDKEIHKQKDHLSYYKLQIALKQLGFIFVWLFDRILSFYQNSVISLELQSESTDESWFQPYRGVNKQNQRSLWYLQAPAAEGYPDCSGLS